MKALVLTSQVFVLTLTLILGAYKSPGISPSWTALHISSNEICSMPFGNFRVNVYEHLDNQKAAPNRKRYFYAPIALLDQKSAISVFNDVTNQAEMRFRVELWNEKVETDVAKYLIKIVGEPVKTHQVQVIPFEKVILTNKETRSSYSLPTTWSLIKLQKSLWFTVTCFQQIDCDNLASNMRTPSSQQFQTLQIHFSLLSQPSEIEEVEIVVSGQMVARLLRQFKKEKEIFLTEKDEDRLLTEIATSSVVDKLNLNAVISFESLRKQFNVIKRLLVSSAEVLTVTQQTDPIWAFIFWNNENYRPGKTSQVLNYIYEKQSKEIQLKLSNAFTLTSDKIDLEEIVQLFRSMEYQFNVNSFAPINSKEFLKNLYNESKNHVEWDGEKFKPKPLVVSKVNLELLREHYEKNYQLQEKEHRIVNVRYLVAAISTPINVAQSVDIPITSSTDELESLRSIVNNLMKEMKGISILMYVFIL